MSLYVMTPEYGAPSQLEKIGMLDYADLVAVNKFDRRGGEDALRDVRKQVRRNRKAFEADAASLGVYGTVASRFCDAGVDALFEALLARAAGVGGREPSVQLPATFRKAAPSDATSTGTIPPDRVSYLAEIVRTVRGYRAWAEEQIQLARSVDRAGGCAGRRGRGHAARRARRR